MFLEIITMGAYLLAMLIIGIVCFRGNKSNADYVLGGRKLGVWQAAMSAQASDMSGWLLMGLPGLAVIYFITKDGAATASYNGLLEAIWTAVGLAIGTYLNWLIVAKRLRKFTQVYDDSITLPEFFEKRFDDKSGIIRFIAAVFILIFFTVYSAAQFAAGAKLFRVLFPNIDYTAALLIGAVIIVSYTFLGGFSAVCKTDLVQGILMFIVLLIVPIVAFSKLGGGAGTSSTVNEIASSLGESSIKGTATFALITSSLAWGLGYFGQPHILARFMGIRDSKEVRPARIIAMIWVIITLACAILVGYLAAPYLLKFKGVTEMPIEAGNAENIFIYMTQSIFTKEALGAIAGPIIIGLFLCAVLAAIMSTADSQLLVASSAFSQDIFTKITKDKKDSFYMWVSRITVVIISLIAILIANDPGSSVFRIVQDAWAGFGAAFGPLVLFSIFWKRTTKAGALSGMVSGGLIALFWKTVFPTSNIYCLLPGFIVSAILIVVVSLLTKKPSKDIEDKFDKALKADI
ncbi:MAG: sodium/proline symporter PutP [Clostridia bacterium]|nr:sodium/proline symporter PutP [Clostridia bacterium]